jgi:hypothetical protein
MNLASVQNKHLNQIEDLAKHLLIALSQVEWESEALSEELTVLAIETSDERKLRAKSDAEQPAKDASNLVSAWENEGGNTNVQTPALSLNQLQGDIRGHAHSRR